MACHLKEKEKLQSILKQEKGIDWVSWVDEGQDYLKNEGHESNSHNDVDSAWIKTPECEEKMKDSSMNEAREGSEKKTRTCWSTVPPPYTT